MKKAFLACLIIIGFPILAQPIQYSYDNYGNRTQRKLDCPNCPGTERQMVTEEEKKTVETEIKLGLNVFPNPAQDKMQVEIKNLSAEEQATIMLMDAQGKNLFSQKTSALQNEVDMAPYKPGVYFIKVLVGKETLFYKVLKL